jgi:hypothetical protein
MIILLYGRLSAEIAEAISRHSACCRDYSS